MTAKTNHAQLARGDVKLPSRIWCLHPQGQYTHQLWIHLKEESHKLTSFNSYATYRTHSSGIVREDMLVNATYIV